METTIPDGLPTLDKGAHTPHRGRACVMEYVSLLAGEEWGDSPTCTYHLLAGAARCVNDQGRDEDRQGLLTLVPRLLTANRPGLRNYTQIDCELMEAVRQYGLRYGYDLSHYGGYMPSVYGEIIRMETNAGRGITVLTHMLDAFDRIVGPREPAVVSDEQYAKATKAITPPFMVPVEQPVVTYTMKQFTKALVGSVPV